LRSDGERPGVPRLLPFAPRTFDAVISLFSLHHWHYAPAVFSEISRVLAPGGVLVVSGLTADDLARFDERTRRLAKYMFEIGPAAKDYYSWLDGAGLRVLEAYPTFVGRHGLLLVAEKGSR
jgi:SAM-dependent methyltransferase